MKHLKSIIVMFLAYAFELSICGITFIAGLVVYYIADALGASSENAILIGIIVPVVVVMIFAFVTYSNELENTAQEKLSAQFRELERQRELQYTQLVKDHQALDHRAQSIALLENEFQNILKSTEQTHPWLAKEVADFLYTKDNAIVTELRYKNRPAIKASEQVKAIAKEKRLLQVKCKEQEYQLAYYETLFPWLEEFKELPPSVGAEYAQMTQSSSNDEYDLLRKWLSPEEYAELSTTDKFQLALDRYKSRSKSDWEVGIEYERYVGYRYESEGYYVHFHGALMGKQDMGRDLIASKDGRTLVIQCKRWSKNKAIHEKHIFQLYGSAVQMTVEENKKCFPVFITTSTLSDTARKCAEYLQIDVAENFEFADYPMIKCNISRDGEKIYHLPFDQQYDRVRIRPGSGEAYVATVKEAESLGFRRAYRWHGEKTTV